MVALFKCKAQMYRAGHGTVTLASATTYLANKEDKALGKEVTEGAKTVVWVKYSNAGEKKRSSRALLSRESSRHVQALTRELKKEKGDTASSTTQGAPNHLLSVIPATCSSHTSSASRSVAVVEMGLGYAPQWGRKAKGAWRVGSSGRFNRM